MTLFDYTNPRMIVADRGKQIRAINDVYEPEYTDEEGHLIPEHIPYYSTTIFVPDSITQDNYEDLYVEEEMEG